MVFFLFTLWGGALGWEEILFNCISLTLLIEMPQPAPRSDLLQAIFKLFFILVTLH